MQIRDRNDIQQLTDFFAALAHPLRLRIMRMLIQRPMCVSRLCVALGVPQPTVSRNLGILRRAGLVYPMTIGTFVRYGLTENLAGISLKAVQELIAEFVAATYDEDEVNRELARLGIAPPPKEERCAPDDVGGRGVRPR
jgi:ArsR family transcriptional regulator